MQIRRPLTLVLGAVGTVLIIGAVIVAAQGAPAPAGTQAAKPSTAARRVTAPPLPAMGFAPVRPMEIVRATYDFAAQHPEVLKFVPCYCGCGSEGHSSNESCFIARRDARGNVTEWDTHGYGCTICVDVAREAMQLYSSGADVNSIRAAIEKKWTPSHPGSKTPTPFPPRK
jgi:hypothetical protein